MTKEQIESLGWLHEGGGYYNFAHQCMLTLLKEGRIEIGTYYKRGNWDTFRGVCDDIETLQLAMKLLKIKNFVTY